MPIVNTYGTPSAGNDAIGGVPTIHYLDFASKGRGQVVRLMLEDAGIAYEDVRYTFEEFPEVKKDKIMAMNPVASVPVIELNGKVLTQSYAILRHFARILGQYEGVTEEEKYWTDVMCDIATDWRTLFVQAFFAKDKEVALQAHCEGDRSRFLNAMEAQLKSNPFSKPGPFVIGEEITYADFVIYQILHDEGLTKGIQMELEAFPCLSKLVEAVEKRPNIEAYMRSSRYKG